MAHQPKSSRQADPSLWRRRGADVGKQPVSNEVGGSRRSSVASSGFRSLEDSGRKSGLLHPQIDVAIGHTGFMHCDGERVTLEDLEVKFGAADTLGAVTVIIQAHPRAPKDLVEDVSDAAKIAGHKVVIDTNRMPFVPDYGQEYND